MDNQEKINYVNGRFKTYTYHKLNLTDNTSQEQFYEYSNELLSDINDDTKMLMEIESSGEPIPKPVVEKFASLGQYSDRVLDFYCKYKLLKGY